MSERDRNFINGVITIIFLVSVGLLVDYRGYHRGFADGKQDTINRIYNKESNMSLNSDGTIHEYFIHPELKEEETFYCNVSEEVSAALICPTGMRKGLIAYDEHKMTCNGTPIFYKHSVMTPEDVSMVIIKAIEKANH
jgi:hypothetical protein